MPALAGNNGESMFPLPALDIFEHMKNASAMIDVNLLSSPAFSKVISLLMN
jgi:hypothetical protein